MCVINNRFRRMYRSRLFFLLNTETSPRNHSNLEIKVKKHWIECKANLVPFLWVLHVTCGNSSKFCHIWSPAKVAQLLISQNTAAAGKKQFTRWHHLFDYLLRDFGTNNATESKVSPISANFVRISIHMHALRAHNREKLALLAFFFAGKPKKKQFRHLHNNQATENR